MALYRQIPAFPGCGARQGALAPGTGHSIFYSAGGFMADDAQMVEATVRSTLVDLLGLTEDRVAAFDDATPLFGALPELDSMAVATLLTELEDRLGITIDDDDVDVEMFETFGALVRFAAGKALD